MYQLKTNEKSKTVFVYQEVQNLDVGFFYEDTVGNRFLTFYDRTNGKYAVCISAINGVDIGKYFGKYDRINVRLV